MISVLGPNGSVDQAALGPGEAVPAGAVWIDLVDPTAEEAQRVEAATGLRVPSRAALSEVESSSRLRRLRGGGLSLSSPMLTFDRASPALAPIGFLVAGDRLVTVRFHEIRAYDAVKARIGKPEDECPSSVDIFLALIEELVDGLADTLEETSTDLGSLSNRIFDFDPSAKSGSDDGSRGSPKRRDAALRRLLGSIGRQAKALAKIRASLLGLERIVPFAKDGIEARSGAEERPRFETISRDIASLDEFETRQSETLQFLLDAALGLINIEQNNAFRVLTVVSVVGIPPTLIASMYGMNFKHMPELEWAYGYPYGLALIAVSALVPMALFWIKGWV